MAEDVYQFIPDTSGSETECYEAYSLEQLRMLMTSASPEQLRRMATVWNAASDKLDSMASTIKSEATKCSSAWQGAGSSVKFQEAMRKQHGSARYLADNARRMSTTMTKMADVAEEMRSAGEGLAPEPPPSGFFDAVGDALFGDPDMSEMKTALAQQGLRRFHERYERIMREEPPNFIAVDLPVITPTLPGRDDISPPQTPGVPGTSGYDGGGGWSGSTPFRTGGSGWDPPAQSAPPVAAVATPAESGDWSQGVPAPGDPSFGADEPADQRGVGSRAWEVDDDFRRADGTSLAGFHPGGGASYTPSGGAWSAGGGAGSGFGGGSAAPSPGIGGGGVPGSGGSGGAYPGPAGVRGFGGGTTPSVPGGRGMMPPMMPPAGGQQSEEEREREFWDAEDRNVWGIDDADVMPPVIGQVEPEDEQGDRRRRRG